MHAIIARRLKDFKFVYLVHQVYNFLNDWLRAAET